MKKLLIKTTLLATLLISLSLLCVYFFTSPAIWIRLDLTNTSSIGDTIGGITTPFLGIISVIFLYLTLNKQIDSINDQKLKNESDIIFMLFNQLDSEYNQIYLNSTANNRKTKVFGQEALVEYTNSVFKFYNDSNSKKWSNYYMADNILLVVRSYKLIQRRIEISNIDTSIKEMFQDKLKTFFACRLKDPLFKLTDLFQRVQALKDDYTLEITEFYKKQSTE